MKRVALSGAFWGWVLLAGCSGREAGDLDASGGAPKGSGGGYHLVLAPTGDASGGDAPPVTGEGPDGDSGPGPGDADSPEDDRTDPGDAAGEVSDAPRFVVTPVVARVGPELGLTNATFPIAMVAASGQLFFLDQGPVDGPTGPGPWVVTLNQVPTGRGVPYVYGEEVDGGPVRGVRGSSPGMPLALLAQGGSLFWLVGDPDPDGGNDPVAVTLHQTPEDPAGTDTTVFRRQGPMRVFGVDDAFVYAVVGSSLLEVPRNGGADVPLVTEDGEVVAALLAGDTVFWLVNLPNVDATRGQLSPTGALRRMPTAGGAPVTVSAPFPYQPAGALAADGTNVYWSVHQGFVLSTPRAGGAVTITAHRLDMGSLFADDAGLYGNGWSWGDTTIGGAVRIHLDGASDEQLEVNAAVEALDDTSIYLASAGAVIERAR